MKDGIHPKYGKCVITCGCGAVFETRSTAKDYSIDICSVCHPYYTGDGSSRLIDAAGRIEKFNRRYKKKAS